MNKNIKTDKKQNEEINNNSNENQKMELGKIVNTFGLNGEISIY